MRQHLWFLTTLVMLGLMSACRESHSDKVEGAVSLKPELQEKISSSAVLYIVARTKGVRSGPPLAVQRVTQPFTFPIEFELSKKNVMLPEKPFKGSIQISARISQTGTAAPINPGDIEGASTPVEVVIGDGKTVTIELNHVR